MSLANVLGRVPSGLFILTSRHDGLETGMLASWVMQAGFQPPMVSVAVRQDRYVADWLSAGAPFALHLLGEGHKPLLKHFGKGFEPGQEAFAGLAIERSPHGLPLLTDCLGRLICEPAGHVDSGDHRLFLAKVIDGAMLDDAPPAIHVRKSGLHY